MLLAKLQASMCNTTAQSGNRRTKILMLECWRWKDKEHRMSTKSVLGNTTLNIQTLAEEIKSPSKPGYLWESNKVNSHGFAPVKSPRCHISSLQLFLQEQFSFHVWLDCWLLCFLVRKFTHLTTLPLWGGVESATATAKIIIVSLSTEHFLVVMYGNG